MNKRDRRDEIYFSWKELLAGLTGSLCQGMEAQLYGMFPFFLVPFMAVVVGTSVTMVPTLHALEGVRMEVTDLCLFFLVLHKSIYMCSFVSRILRALCSWEREFWVFG